MKAREAGVTLMELLVVLVMLGVLLAVSALTMGTMPKPATSALGQAQVRARLEALRTGAPVVLLLDTIPSAATLRPTIDGSLPRSGRAILYLPDGRAEGEGVDPLTGQTLPELGPR